MGHHTVKQGYLDLADRINRFPQGAPPSELLFQILQMLFSEREAELVALLPIRPFDAQKAARVWKTTPGEARVVLDELSSRAILRLPPVQRTMASGQLGSRYLEKLIELNTH